MGCGEYTGTGAAGLLVCWRFQRLTTFCTCRRCVAALEFIAQKKADTQLTEQNKQAMALTHGFAHGLVQSALFSIRSGLTCLDLLAASKENSHNGRSAVYKKLLTLLQTCCSWLPLSLGDATYYVPKCSGMSYFLTSGKTGTISAQVHCNMLFQSAIAEHITPHDKAGSVCCESAALLSLGFFFLHAASMVIYFKGLTAGHLLQVAMPSALHLLTSLLVRVIAFLTCMMCMSSLKISTQVPSSAKFVLTAGRRAAISLSMPV